MPNCLVSGPEFTSDPQVLLWRFLD